MKLKYIIQIENQDNYPFDSHKPQQAHVIVRTIFSPNKESFIQIQNKIHKLINLTLNSTMLTQISKVTEIRGKLFKVDFQYIAESLKNSSKMSESSFAPKLKEILTHFYKYLSCNSIKYHFSLDDIGITQTGEVKIYPGIKFQIVSSVENENLEEEYQVMLQKFMENHFNFRSTVRSPSDNTFATDYSHKVNKKLSELEGRLNKMRKYSKQTSSSGFTAKDEKIDEKPNFLPLVTPPIKKQNRTNTVAAGLTSNSLIHQKNPFEQTRPHKFSFADYSTSSNRLDDSSSKESSLTQRITNALEKTEVAFKVYQKYSQRKNRRRN